jgi:hypothetical protein
MALTIAPESEAATLDRIRKEYVEMPGLRLTSRQARRLWHLDPQRCDALLRSLVEAGFLTRTQGGVYCRALTKPPWTESVPSWTW